MPLSNPINLVEWTKKNSHLLRPPVNNHCIYEGDVTVMILGGPNARTDYHVNVTPEWFYQYRGSMLLKVIDPTDDHKFKDIRIGEGDMFLLPANTPHNPVRFADTAGVVIEQKRPKGSVDRLQWYCQNCERLVKEAAFHCTDLGTQIRDAINVFKNSGEERRCKHCEAVCDVAPRASFPD